MACYPAALRRARRRSSWPRSRRRTRWCAQGCYTCLKEALAIYDKHAAAKVPIPGAREGQFDAALLIAIREKELGIPGDESMARALRLRSAR